MASEGSRRVSTNNSDGSSFSGARALAHGRAGCGSGNGPLAFGRSLWRCWLRRGAHPAPAAFTDGAELAIRQSNEQSAPSPQSDGTSTSHGVIRGSLATRLKDIGVVGRVRRRYVERAGNVFEGASAEAARIAMIHHNPLRGAVSGRHGLANTKTALKACSLMGVELVLRGHDHQDAVHTIEELAPGLVVSTAGTVSDRMRPGRSSSFNAVEVDGSGLAITTYSWSEDAGFAPLKKASFRRGRASRPA